jgi:hypothetical protein
MRYFPATDLEHQSLEELLSQPKRDEIQQSDPIKGLYIELEGYLSTFVV